MSDQAVHVGPGHVGPGAETPRRDFLLLVAGALGGIGLVSALWPFVDSLEPAEDTIAAGAPVDIDLAPVKPGQQVIVKWRGRPIFVMRRTPDQLKMLQNTADTGLLRDPNSEELQQPTYAKNWHRSVNPEYLILVGICTHLGCIPEFKPKDAQVGGASWPGGYFCPCHGSKYDFSGRVFEGVPAPYNLPVPPYFFTAKDKVRIGENPKDKDASYSLSDIEQM